MNAAAQPTPAVGGLASPTIEQVGGDVDDLLGKRVDIRSTIDRIVVHEAPKRGDPDVALVEMLVAQMIAYAQESKTAGSTGDGKVGGLDMVAGARNHRDRTRFIWKKS